MMVFIITGFALLLFAFAMWTALFLSALRMGLWGGTSHPVRYNIPVKLAAKWASRDLMGALLCLMRR